MQTTLRRLAFMMALGALPCIIGSSALAGCPPMVIPGPCGELSPAVPVVTYYGTPVVQTTPGHYFGPAAPRFFCRAVSVQPKYYIHCQPLRNTLRAITP